MNKPEPGKLYALTGATGTKAISNGNTWADSEVVEDPKTGKVTPAPEKKETK